MSHSDPVIRHDALSHCRMLFSGDFRLLVMAARAGQGKTTLARQFMASAPFFWHACSPSQSDSSVFMESLTHSLKLPSLPEGGSPDNRWEQSLARLLKAAPDLGPGLLIVDDYHLVMDTPPNRHCLQQLLAHSPLRLVILTREYPEHAVLAPLGDTLFIDNDLLALSLDETAQVVQAADGVPVAASTIRDIHALTEGWPGGVRLLLEHGRLNGSTLNRQLPELSGNRILQAMGLLWADASPKMALLADLERIPGCLLGGGTPWRAEGELLASLADRACFVRIQKDRDGEWVILHHLLRDAFAARKSSLTPEFRRHWAEVLGTDCLAQGLVEEGLLCLSREGCLDSLGDELSRHGLALLGRGRFSLVGSLLDALPSRTVESFPWLSLHRGIILLTADPVSARPWLEQSLSGMRETRDKAGELHAIGRLVEYEVLHGGAYGRLAPDIRRGSALIADIPLAVHHRRHILAALTLGACYALDGTAAHGLLCQLEPELTAEGADHLDLFSLLVPCLHAILRTDVPRALAELDARVVPEHMDGLSPSSRFAVHFCLLNILRIRGRSDDFSLAGAHVRTRFASFLTSPYLVKMTRTWEALAALRNGWAGEALGIFEEVLKTTGGQDNIHAVTLSWKALCLAHLGRHDEARDLSAEVGPVGDLNCGHYYARHCAVILGCSRSLDPADDGAVPLLTRHISSYTLFDDASIQALGLGYLARRHLADGAGSTAMGYVTHMLAIMETVDCLNFAGFEPRIFAPLFSASVADGAESSRACMAARRMLGVDLLSHGRAVPVLDIRPAPGGRLEVFCPVTGKRATVRAAQQIQLMILLLRQPGACLAADRLASLLWPGKDPLGLRGRLDNLMKRLRQVLAEAAGPESPRHYLGIEAGTAVLRHVRCEAARLDTLLAEGRLLLEKKRPWTASIPLTRAFSLLNDPAPFSPDPEQVRRAALAWCPVLARTHGTDRALDAARCALSLHPLSPSLNRLVHDLCLDADQPQQALEQVDCLRRGLRQAGHSIEEQDAVMESFWG
ncbi:hypothetical protein [Desulfoluna spongiiphila]|uniref:Uncharacterized protein n=1 Tax=Desulfoluna spongiiphila TaxID=419481 RepID=A0A1G5BR80_9BACT|nr:hypothetical protein [Desulfoluna spongiiphila]SCX92735.1 hypothetical protein SAMN05216233_102155 [Desulfoluna spongiiphila]